MAVCVWSETHGLRGSHRSCPLGGESPRRRGCLVAAMSAGFGRIFQAISSLRVPLCLLSSYNKATSLPSLSGLQATPIHSRTKSAGILNECLRHRNDGLQLHNKQPDASRLAITAPAGRCSSGARTRGQSPQKVRLRAGSVRPNCSPTC